jgi:hypothetical protein
MARKANTYLLHDDVSPRLICQNLVISLNEGARISHFAVSDVLGSGQQHRARRLARGQAWRRVELEVASVVQRIVERMHRQRCER